MLQNFLMKILQPNPPRNKRSLPNNNANFSCDKHLDAVKKLSSRTIVNIFYNNKRLERSALQRKQTVVAFKSNKRSKKAKGED